MLVNEMAIEKVVGVVAVALLSVTPAYAVSYRFTTVVDSQRDGLEATRCPAINTRGAVAVTVEDNAFGLTKIVTKRGAADAPVVVRAQTSFYLKSRAAFLSRPTARQVDCCQASRPYRRQVRTP